VGSPGKTALQFKPTAGRLQHAIVLIADLEGFSAFCNIPDAQLYAARFLNCVGEALNICIRGGNAYWIPPEQWRKRHQLPLPAPTHQKFLGDGALFLWVGSQHHGLSTRQLTSLCNRLWNLQEWFEAVREKAAATIPIADLPRRIRFGLAGGMVTELVRTDNGQKEYVGSCMNLASRLQKYCPRLAFIASDRAGIPSAKLRKYSYRRVIATAIRGFPNEVVFVDKDGFEAIPKSERKRLFAAQ
jgi:class 3 adenylate cyclase